MTLGERQKGDPAQDPATTLGKVVRIGRDGTIPSDNPGLAGARPEIRSSGHRNPQGAAIRPGTGELWVTEHGPQGGDEMNRIVPGGNHGWPLVSYGCNYGDPVGDACRIGGGTHAPRFVEPVGFWGPTSIAPAGLVFYTGTRYPAWQGNAFMPGSGGEGPLAGRAPGRRGGGAGASPRRPGRAHPRRRDRDPTASSTSSPTVGSSSNSAIDRPRPDYPATSASQVTTGAAARAFSMSQPASSGRVRSRFGAPRRDRPPAPSCGAAQARG